MAVTVAKTAGFCFGVKNAVEMTLSHAGEDVSVLGDLIHNDFVTEKIKNAGIKTAYKPEDVGTAAVIVRSHGEGKAIYDYFEQKGITVYDATCPFVKRIHNIVQKAHSEGKSIIILGKEDHAEIKGINGWCDNSALIFNDEFDLDLLESGKEYVLVSQTTFSREVFNKIKQNIEKQHDKTLEIFDTICYTTKERQLEAEDLAKSNDVVIVIGGKHSSNTAKLFDICSRYCDRTYYVDNISELSSVKFNNKKDRLAIIAGASTPEELIEEVRNTMSEMETKSTNEVIAEEKVTDCVAEVATNEEIITMDDVMKSSESKMAELKAGRRMVATVLSANESGIQVALTACKKDGFIAKEDVNIDGSYNPAEFKKDDKIEVQVIENKKDKSYISLSKKAVDIIREGDAEAEKALSSNEFTLEVSSVVKGGLLGKLGSYTVFVPASQIKTSFVKNLDEYVGKKLRLRALPAKEDEEGRKPNPKRIVASQRVILEEERAAREEEFWAEMVEGATVNGKVKRFTDFGAFVSVKGFDCLARNNDLAWYRIEKPSDVLELNQKYDFIVLSADRETKKIALGYKQLQKTPYEQAAEKYLVGDVIRGKVVRISPFGAFVSLEPGVDGLVHISQISHGYVKSIEEALKVGDEVDAKIIKFENNRITLSIKETLPEPEVVETEVAEGEEGAKPVKKFAKRFDAAEGEEAKKYREAKKEKRERAKKDDGEPHEWHSDNGVATLGDLFKGLDLKLDD